MHALQTVTALCVRHGGNLCCRSNVALVPPGAGVALLFTDSVDPAAGPTARTSSPGGTGAGTSQRYNQGKVQQNASG